MVWIDYDTYRGCTLKYSDTDPKLYWSPCVAYPSTSKAALKADIDLTLGPVEEPPSEPDVDYIKETYRGVDIWWKVSLKMFWAQVAVGYTATGWTLLEIKGEIDRILEFLEPPEDPEEGLFAQVVAAIKVWMLANLPDWLLEWGKVVNNWVTYVDESINYWGDQVTEYIDNSITYWTEEITNIYNTTRKYITKKFYEYNDYITNVHNTFNEYVTNIIGVSQEILDNNLVDLAAWVRGLLSELDPHNFLPNPQGYIATAFDTLIAPWVERIVTNFWEGLEEGLEE